MAKKGGDFIPKNYKVQSEILVCHCARKYIRICSKQKECPRCLTPEELREVLELFDKEHNANFRKDKNRQKVIPVDKVPQNN